MDIFLQLWGGTGYLLAKILLSHAEGLQNDRPWRISGWLAYLAGLPAWVILLLGRQNWIAAAIEAGGTPALLLGLASAWQRRKHFHRFIEWSVTIFTCLMIALGISYSAYYFKGITTVSQVLEIGVTIGFLMGSFLLAKKKASGWLLFALMLVSMGILMFIQEKIVLVFQQGISLIFAAAGFVRAVRRKKTLVE